MSISVIIPTYNGAHKILHILKCLEQQKQLPDEVLVVVDGSTDNTVALLQQQQFSFPSFRIIEQENGGRAKVRNSGARQASGDLFVFFDDDMLPMPDCITEHIQHHRRHPGTILTGATIDPDDDTRTDIQRFKASCTRKWSEPLIQLAGKPIPENNVFITAANFSIAKATFLELDGFDERLTDAEDYDLAVRAVKKGIDLYYNHQAFAWHDDRVTCAGYIKRMRQYTISQQALQAIKPELYGARHKFAIQKPAGIKAILFKSFCFPFWIRSVDKERWTFLPEKLRFKLYDWIITANGSFYTDKVKL